MYVSKRIRLLEKLAQMPPQAAMPPEAAAPQGPPPEMAVPPEAAAAAEEMPGGDPEGAEEKLQMLMETLSGAAGDAAKFDAGNSSAGTRLRKKALQAAKQLKSLRAEVQATKGSRKEEKAQATIASLQQAAAAQQEQARAEAAMDKAPADKLFNPSQGGEPPQPAPPQMMPPKMASIDKEAWRAALGRGMRNLGVGVGEAQKGSTNMLRKGFGDLTLGEKVLGVGLGAGALTAGVRGADAAMDGIGGPMKERKAFNSMMQENPSLAGEDQGDVKKIFRTLHNFNPDMAKDPLVAGSFMRRSLQYKDEGIQPQDVKTLAEIGKLRADTKKKDTLLQAMLGAGLGG